MSNKDLTKEEMLVMRGIIQGTILAFTNAKEAGWYTDINTGEPKKMNSGERIALMHSELSEALEGLRKNKMDPHLPQHKNVTVELADCIIRIFDFAGANDLPIGSALIEKMRYNKSRVDHSLAARRDAGKQF